MMYIVLACIHTYSTVARRHLAAATGDLSTFKTSSWIFRETATFDLPTFNSYPSLDTQKANTRIFEVAPKRSDFSPVAQNLSHVRSP